jgi:hypothetical protein
MPKRFPPLPTLQPGDLLRGSDGTYYCVTTIDAPDWVHVERFGKQPIPPTSIDPSMFFGVDPKALVSDFGCELISRGEFVVGEPPTFEVESEVKTMDKDTKKATAKTGGTKEYMDSIRVRVTNSYLRQKGQVSLTLTRQELEQIAKLLRAGKVLINDTSSVSKSLRAAMSKLGVDTKGL